MILPPSAAPATPAKPRRKPSPFKSPLVAAAHRYAEDVAAGRLVAGEMVRLMCVRHLRDMETAGSRGLVFDPSAADRVLRYFPAVLRHSKGEWGGRPVELEPWQLFHIASIFGWKWAETGLRRYRQAYLSMGRKNGKALALDTPIPTPRGFVPMGSIRPGMEVLGRDGQPVKVVAESPVMIGRPCYKVRFSTGEEIIADAEHLWLTSARSLDVKSVGPQGSARKIRGESVKTTARIAETLSYGKGGKVEWNHRVESPRRATCRKPIFWWNPTCWAAGSGTGTAALAGSHAASRSSST